MGRVTWKGCSISSLSGSRLLLGSYGSEGVPMGPRGSLWVPMSLYGSECVPMGALWGLSVSLWGLSVSLWV